MRSIFRRLFLLKNLILIKYLNNKPVLLYDLQGNNSMDVVDILRAKGFTRIYNLFEGLAALSCDHATSNQRSQLFTDLPSLPIARSASGYCLINPTAQYESLLIQDLRTNLRINHP